MIAAVRLAAYAESHGFVVTLCSASVIIHVPYSVAGGRFVGVEHVTCRTLAEVRAALGY